MGLELAGVEGVKQAVRAGLVAPHASAAARATQRFLDACLALP
ncbi:transcriptional regulator [Bordetella pertussis]|nr:transcriptional regulator [Bordetella pertussis]